jgi:hypothetical protein
LAAEESASVNHIPCETSFSFWQLLNGRPTTTLPFVSDQRFMSVCTVRGWQTAVFILDWKILSWNRPMSGDGPSGSPKVHSLCAMFVCPNDQKLVTEKAKNHSRRGAHHHCDMLDISLDRSKMTDHGDIGEKKGVSGHNPKSVLIQMH